MYDDEFELELPDGLSHLKKVDHEFEDYLIQNVYL